MKIIKALSLNLYKIIIRDSFMLFIFSLPLFVALIFRILLPIIRINLLQYFDLSEYYNFITIFIIIIGPMLSGMVIGFNLLDDRDENILSYMAITPIRKRGYLLFKVFAPMIAVLIQSILILLIFNLGNISMLRIAPLILICSLETPMYALIMASLADNKVEGLAIGKLTGISLMGPFVSYFMSSNWKYVAGVLPTFWICECYFSYGLFYWILMLVGVIHHLLFVGLTFKIFIDRSD